MSDQREKLGALLNTVIPTWGMGGDGFLSEILYTACETGLLDIDSMDTYTARRIWQMVELSNRISPEQIKDIRM